MAIKFGEFFQPERWATITIFALIIVQIVALFLTQLFGVGSNVKLGPGIVLISIGIAVSIALKIVFGREFSFGFTDFVVLLLTMGIVALVMFYLPVAAPGIFSSANDELVQSIILRG